MIQHSSLPRYDDLRLARLRVTFEASPGVVSYDPIFLDGLLAAAIVREATRGEGLPPSGEPYDIALPLECLWRSDEGLPLWAASCFHPIDPIEDTMYLHRRQQTGQFTTGTNGKLLLKASTGRFMERRVPTPVTVATRWEAMCVGDADEIARLLAHYVSHVGKRRGAGLGDVMHWSIEEMPGQVLVHEGALSRPIPEGARHLIPPPVEEPSDVVGWTPPYWLAATQARGWRAGTPITEEVPA